MKQEQMKIWERFLKGLLVMTGILFIATGIGYLFRYLGFSEENIILVYILGVLIIAIITVNRGWSVCYSLLSVLLFNFLFTEPRFTFFSYDYGYPVTFVTVFIAAVIVSNLTIQIRKQGYRAEQMALRTRILLETNQMLQKAKNADEMIEETARHLMRMMGKNVIYYRAEDGILSEPRFCMAEPGAAKMLYLQQRERQAAQWVFENRKRAGTGMDQYPDAHCLYLAIRNEDMVYGVIGIALEGMMMDVYEQNLILSILGECALALEKEGYNRKREEALAQAKNEQLRANLLRSISHDLRTPLTSISGSAGILLNSASALGEEKQKQLYKGIYDDSMWLINLVENLLSVTRLEDGTMNLNLQIELVDEVIEGALKHISRDHSDYELKFIHSEELLLAKMDSRLIIQVIINIVDNALKYTPKGSKIEIYARKENQMIAISIADNGKGIADCAKEKIFDMFYTADSKVADSRRGLGLGLFLCKSIIQAHGGTIQVADNVPHGTIFTFTLQAEEVTLNE